MQRRHRIPVLLSAGALALSGVAIATPAAADDRPPVFTFNGTRGSGDLVHYSGQYATWNDASQSYQAASDEVSLTLRYTNTDEPGELARFVTTTPDAAGNFSFDESIPGTLTFFASDGEVPLNDLGPGTESQPVTVSAVRTVPTGFDGVEAFSVKHPLSKSPKPPIQVDGGPGQIVATDVATGQRFQQLLLEPITVQWKIGKHWKTARTVRSSTDDGGFQTVFKSVRSTTWRALISAGHGHAAATSPVFKTAPRRSLN